MPYADAPGVLFLDKRKDQSDPYSSRLVFSSDFMTKRNTQQYQIHEMTLYSDFKETLMKIGRLPEVTVRNVVNLELDNRAKDHELNKLRDLKQKLSEINDIDSLKKMIAEIEAAE